MGGHAFMTKVGVECLKGAIFAKGNRHFVAVFFFFLHGNGAISGFFR